MYGKVISSCVNGMNGRLVEVEIDLCSGLPQMNIVGLPDNSIRESSDRIRSAIKNCNFSFPMERITVNLAPADLRKEGSTFDLAIAVGILQTSGQIRLRDLERTLFIGELALDGGLRPIPGVLPMVHSARNEGMVKVMLPLQNASEAALVEGIEVIPVSHLQNLSAEKQIDPPSKSLNGNNYLLHKSRSDESGLPTTQEEDFNDVLGQYQAKRALMIAGKSSYAIQMMNDAPLTQKFIYVTPLIDEVKRIIDNVKDRTFSQPDGKDSRKFDSFKRLIGQGVDIATTHSLFSRADDDLMELIRERGYTLIIDEVMDVIEQVKVKKDDPAVMLKSGLIEIDPDTSKLDGLQGNGIPNTIT